jgi:hypothetical protein
MQRLLRRGALVFGLCGLAALAAVPASASASSSLSLLRGFSVVISPASVNGGTTTTMTATIKDEMLLIPIQSAELFVPAGLTVVSAAPPAGSRAKAAVTTCKHGTTTSQCVQLSNLLMLPGRSITITMSVQAAPGCSVASLTWGAAARPDALIALLLQLLGFGNLPLDAANSGLATTVNDSCHLAFTTEPASVDVGTAITANAFAAGPPVAVEILDATNTLMASSTASVTVALANNPSVASLGGSAALAASGGVASFASLTVSQPGLGYTLGASSSGMASATSTPFDAQTQGTVCTTNPCSVTASNNQGSSQITATGPGGTSGTLTDSVNVPGEPPLSCGNVSADPNTYDFFTTNAGLDKVVTITITQPQGNLPLFDPDDTDFAGDGDGDFDDVLVAQRICFQAPYDFGVDGGGLAPGTVVGGATVFTGLLPSCNDPNTGPCDDRAADSTPGDPNSRTRFDIILVAEIPAAPGDPRMN